MGRHYEVMYWGYNDADGTEMTELRRAVTIPTETMQVLMSGMKVSVYHFIVEDGTMWLLPARLLCEIRELLDFE